MAVIEEAQIGTTEVGGSVTITGGGFLTYMNAEEFGVGLRKASQSAESVTVDIRPASFIDTQIVQDLGMAAVTLLKRTKRLKVVAAADSYPLRVLNISGYGQIMDVAVEQTSQ